MPGATTIDQSGNAYTDYLHYDHLGSVDAITDDSANVIQTMSFDAYGIRRDPSNWDYDLSQNQISTLKDYTDRGYTGQEELDNVALVDLNGRVYDPSSGRFINADPLVSNLFDSEALNRYTYVYNNPLNATDPTGHLCDCPMTGQQLQQWTQFSASVSPQVMLGIMGIGEIVVGVASAEGDPFSGELISNGAENISTALTVSDVVSAAASSVVATQGVVDLSSSLFSTPDPNVVDALVTPTIGPNAALAANDLLLVKDFNDFLKSPSVLNSTSVTLDLPSIPSAIATEGPNNNGNLGNNLIQLPLGCGCDGSYTGPNEAGSNNSIPLGQITVTPPPAPSLPPTVIPPPPPPQPAQPIKCMDSSGKLTTCPT